MKITLTFDNCTREYYLVDDLENHLKKGGDVVILFSHPDKEEKMIMRKKKGR